MPYHFLVSIWQDYTQKGLTVNFIDTHCPQHIHEYLLTKVMYNISMEHTTPNNSGNTVDRLLRNIIHNYRQKTLVFFITMASLLLSVLLTVTASLTIEGLNMAPSIAIAIMVPLIVAPFISWTLVGLFVQIERMERQMRDLATFDSLTGLLTRQAFFHDAQNYLNIAERHQDYFAAMMLDLDHFKVINDTFGHHAGDRVLKQFGMFLTKHLRKSDIIGRLGGEEFAVILPSTLPEDALTIADTIRSELKDLALMENNVRIPLTVSIGVASCPSETLPDINSILKQADIALYRAKHSGRNHTILFDESLEKNQVFGS
jgi:diguanylate cyclase (GGDEF)-like protein